MSKKLSEGSAKDSKAETEVNSEAGTVLRDVSLQLSHSVNAMSSPPRGLGAEHSLGTHRIVPLVSCCKSGDLSGFPPGKTDGLVSLFD